MVFYHFIVLRKEEEDSMDLKKVSQRSYYLFSKRKSIDYWLSYVYFSLVNELNLTVTYAIDRLYYPFWSYNFLLYPSKDLEVRDCSKICPPSSAVPSAKKICSVSSSVPRTFHPAIIFSIQPPVLLYLSYDFNWR